MNPLLLATIPHPDPLPVPAPHGLVWFLLLLTFFLHLLPMNFVLGGSVMGAISRMRSAASPGHAALSSFFAKSMPVMIAATISFGVAPLLLTQVLYGRLFFSSSVLMAWFWGAVIPLLILGYYAAYLVAFKGEKLGRASVVAAWISALVFLAIGFIYTHNMSMMLRPGAFGELYATDASGWQLNWGDPTLWPRFLHNFFGALAVTGLVVSVWGLIKQKKDAELGRWGIRYGALWFTVTTGINVIWGMWWLIKLPRETMMRFMGQSMLGTISLMLGIVFGLGALVMMAMALVSQKPAGLVRGSVSTLALTLIAMILVRDEVRAGMLESAGFQPAGWVETQWGPLTLFLLLLVGAIVTTVWMIVKLARGNA